MEQFLIPTYHVALAGSILLKGESRKDLDIMVFPHNTQTYDLREIHMRLDAAKLTLRHSNEVIAAKWLKQGSTDTKYVEVWTWEGKRIDVFYPWKPTARRE